MLEQRCWNHVANQAIPLVAALMLGNLSFKAPLFWRYVVSTAMIGGVAYAVKDQWENRDLEDELTRVEVWHDLRIKQEAVKFAALEQRILNPSNLEELAIEAIPELVREPVTTNSEQVTLSSAPKTPETSYKPISFKPDPMLDMFEKSEDSWLDTLINPSALLIYGGDGSGKTSMALELIRRRIAAGHTIVVLDPHANPEKWQGCKVKGGGLNFGEIVEAINNLHAVVKHRYEQIKAGKATECEFQPLTMVCEEMTDWAGEVENAGTLLKKAGNYRKVNVCLLMVSHGNALNNIGSPAGHFKQADNILTQLELLSQPGKDGKPTPARKGYLKRPNSSDRTFVRVPKFTTVPTPTQSTVAVQVRPTIAKDGFPPLHLACQTNDQVKEVVRLLRDNGEVADNELDMDKTNALTLFRDLIASYPKAFDYRSDGSHYYLTTTLDFKEWEL